MAIIPYSSPLLLLGIPPIEKLTFFKNTPELDQKDQALMGHGAEALTA